jgi:O-acetyl-ADP-ribose deacetylase (regulator of RNase III)
LALAQEHGLRSVAFPCISTGIYGYPAEPAARIAVETVTSCIKGNPTIELITFCCFSSKDFGIYKQMLGMK